MARPRRWTGRPGPSRAGQLRARPLSATDFEGLVPCGAACGLAALDAGDLADALIDAEAAAYVAVPHQPSSEPRAPLDPSAPVVVLGAPGLATRCAWIPGGASPDAWVVLVLRAGAGDPDPAVGRLLLRAAVAGLRGERRAGRVQALEAWAGAADPCEGTVAWWRELGFDVVRPHPIRPRVRTELRGWATWRDLLHARRAAYVPGVIAPETYDVARGIQRSRRSSASRS